MWRALVLALVVLQVGAEDKESKAEVIPDNVNKGQNERDILLGPLDLTPPRVRLPLLSSLLGNHHHTSDETDESRKEDVKSKLSRKKRTCLKCSGGGYGKGGKGGGYGGGGCGGGGCGRVNYYPSSGGCPGGCGGGSGSNSQSSSSSSSSSWGSGK